MSAAGMGYSRLPRLGLYAVLIVAAACYLLPLYVMVVTSFKPLAEIRAGGLFALPGEWTIAPWIKAFDQACVGATCTGLRPFYWNSITMVVPAVILSTIIGALNGYILSKSRISGSHVFFGLILFGCFIPYQIILIPMARVLGFLGLSNTIAGLSLVHTVYGICFTTLFFRNYYVSFPEEILKAADVDGAGFMRTFWEIVLPSSVPIFAVTVIFQFTGIWNEFLFGSAFTVGATAPLTVALNNIVQSSTGVAEYNVHMAAAFLAAIPTLLLYVLAGKYFVRGLMAGAVKG